MSEGYWAVSANIEIPGRDGWVSTQQVPTFYLHENVQGILSESAAVKVAADVIDPTYLLRDSGAILHISAGRQ